MNDHFIGFGEQSEQSWHEQRSHKPLVKTCESGLHQSEMSGREASGDCEGPLGKLHMHSHIHFYSICIFGDSERWDAGFRLENHIGVISGCICGVRVNILADWDYTDSTHRRRPRHQQVTVYGVGCLSVKSDILDIVSQVLVRMRNPTLCAPAFKNVTAP